jgi:hypothetical protein
VRPRMFFFGQPTKGLAAPKLRYFPVSVLEAGQQTPQTSRCVGDPEPISKPAGLHLKEAAPAVPPGWRRDSSGRDVERIVASWAYR